MKNNKQNYLIETQMIKKMFWTVWDLADQKIINNKE